MYLYAMYSYVHILATGFIFLVIWFFGLPTRKPILSLHERFECGAGWGLERTLNKWVCQQPWRQRLPLSFFEMLDWQFGNWFNGVSPNCLVSFLEKGLVFLIIPKMRFDVPVPDQHTRKLCSLWPLICFTCRLGKVFGGISLVYQLPLAFVFKVQLTEQQRLLGGNMYCKQHVMPPHDIVASLYEYPDTFFPLLTGEPGRIDHYWTENMDLFRSLDMPDLEAWLPKHLCFGVCLWLRI